MKKAIERSPFFMGITITYNYLNLPIEVKWNASPNKRIEWMYDATGNKLRKTVYSPTGEATNIINYANGFVYTGNFDNPRPQLSFFPMSEGRVVSLGNNNYNLQYILKDHLGNTRVMFDNNNGTAYITQTEMYYPFGLTVTTSVSGDENKFKYNGKELEDEHGLNWYHYGARYYDPQLGRWHTMDPADEFYSPYVYVRDNPVLVIDPTGEIPWPVIYSYNGYVHRHENDFWEKRYRNGIFDHYHEGTDINIGSGSNDRGAPVYATHDGVITSITNGGSGGNRVTITSFDGSIQTKYMHLEKFADIKIGQSINEGATIGYVGNSGCVAVHLHYEMWKDGKPFKPYLDKQNMIDPQILINLQIPSVGTLTENVVSAASTSTDVQPPPLEEIQ